MGEGRATLAYGGHRMAANFERAEAFVRAQGDEFDHARLDLLIGGPLPTNELEWRFLAGQREDGGWPPFWAPDASALDATCYRLSQAEGLQISAPHPTIARALSFIRARQRADGSWEENEALRDLAPPWARPGELAPRLYLTANCGWWLAETSLTGRMITADPAAHRAGDYLASHVAADGSLPSFLHAQWLAAGLWIRLGRDALAERMLDVLATRISGDVPSGALAWMLAMLGGLGIPLDHPLGQKATALLASQQRDDGGWTSEDGPERDASVTVEALRGLLRWCAI